MTLFNEVLFPNKTATVKQRPLFWVNITQCCWSDLKDKSNLPFNFHLSTSRRQRCPPSSAPPSSSFTQNAVNSDTISHISLLFITAWGRRGRRRRANAAAAAQLFPNVLVCSGCHGNFFFFLISQAPDPSLLSVKFTRGSGLTRGSHQQGSRKTLSS